MWYAQSHRLDHDTEITGDPYTSARYTIVSKATSDEEDRSALLTTVLEPIFAPKQKKAV